MRWRPDFVKLPILEFSREVFKNKNDRDKSWKWLEEFTNALLAGDGESCNSFANDLIRESMEFSKKKSEAGKKGMENRWIKKIPLPTKLQEVLDFAADEGLDVDDAREWAEINLKERKGKDKDGKPILNWKGALRNYCKAMERKRNNEA